MDLSTIPEPIWRIIMDYKHEFDEYERHYRFWEQVMSILAIRR